MSCAPRPRTASFFSGLLPTGTQIVTGTPRRGPAQAMISASGRHDATALFHLGKRRQDRKAVPRLERIGGIVVFVLDENFHRMANGVIESRVAPERRRRQVGADALASSEHVLEFNGPRRRGHSGQYILTCPYSQGG